jgi:oxygen-dependent protoporphyrinogen oxidase
MGVKRYDLIVIGGGISGLSIAHYASKAGLMTLLLEKAPETGGCLRTMRQIEGFWLELGAHTCYNSYVNLIGIIEDCGIREMLQARAKAPFLMFVDGKVKSIPSELDFIELFCSAPHIFTLSKSGMTVESYYSKIVGKRNFEKVIGPAMSAVPSQRANDFPAEMLFKKRKRRKEIMKKFTLKGGLQTIADAIISGKGIEILTRAEAKSIIFENSLFKVAVPGAGEFAADNLGFAVPPPVASSLLKDLFPEVAARLSDIKVAHLESLGVIVRKETVGLPPFAGLIPASDLFFSVVSRDTVSDERYRGFTFHFMPGLDYERKIRRIAEVLGTDKFEAFSENSAVIPSPILGHGKVVSDIDRLLEGKKVFVTGNYFSGLAIEDCVTRSSTEFSRLITKS